VLSARKAGYMITPALRASTLLILALMGLVPALRVGMADTRAPTRSAPTPSGAHKGRPTFVRAPKGRPYG
jgi:hypothetical protein